MIFTFCWIWHFVYAQFRNDIISEDAKITVQLVLLAPRPTGNAVFNYATSMLFAPVVSVPMLGVQGLPVGVQLVGQQHEAARMTAIATWLHRDVAPVSA